MATVLKPSRPLDGLRRGASRLNARAASLWRAHPREVAGAGLLGIVATTAIAALTLTPNSPAQRTPAAAPPAPPPMLVRQIAPEQAVKLNAAIPLQSGPNPAAAPFVFKG
ncbi:MAG TPA: hypothetical protein VF750_07065, partial [Sphingomicrobium sp.]